MDLLRECNKMLLYVQHCTPFPCGGLTFSSPSVDSITYTQIRAHIPLSHGPDCTCVATVQQHRHEVTYTGRLLTWLGVTSEGYLRKKKLSGLCEKISSVWEWVENEYKYNCIVSSFVCSLSLQKKLLNTKPLHFFVVSCMFEAGCMIMISQMQTLDLFRICNVCVLMQ